MAWSLFRFVRFNPTFEAETHICLNQKLDLSNKEPQKDGPSLVYTYLGKCGIMVLPKSYVFIDLCKCGTLSSCPSRVCTQ